MGNSLLASNSFGLLKETKVFLTRHFEMKDVGEATFLLLTLRLIETEKRQILGCLKDPT